ncbi:hypothetical protein ACQPZF_26330 [Actinosynnema sp. CS-041913]|uniref:nSTAND1 domain-containing NTPase n=1 Tax=Actinosynnema sp. CS-041913 TaxID=3239917 RepID=UPI003D8C833F
MPRGERPLDPGDGPLLRFAADLRRLRVQAGNPTYRKLSAAVHYSVATLSEAASGRKLPSLPVTLAYVRACRGDVAEWERRWLDLAAVLAVETRRSDEDPVQAPYVGLAAFQADDAERYFGREDLVDRLVERLSRERFAAVVGISGAGKSSLLRAGLLPRLAADPHRSSLVFTPGAHPLEEIAVQAARLTGGALGAALRAEFADDPQGLHRAVRVGVAGRRAEAEVVLVVDQFEEVFTLCRDEAERVRFIDHLVAATRADTSRCRVVIGVRADFYGHCTQYAALADVLENAQVTVGPMTMEELRRAITLPAAAAGCRLEAELLATLLAQAAGQAAVLPLLSHALLETWRRRRGVALTLGGFLAAGGIEGSLAKTAEDVYASLGAGRQALARMLFLRLTAFGEGTEDTKRRIGPGELDTDDPELVAVLEALTSARLIARGRDGIEIAHEALIRSWPRLRDWLAEDRESLRAYRRLTEAVDAWEAVDRDPWALYRGARLAAARELVVGGRVVLGPREREFVDASAAAETDELDRVRRRARRLRQLVAALTALLLVATGATFFALRAQRTVTEQRNNAVSQKVAAQANELRVANPALAAQLGVAAYLAAPTVEARSSLLSTFSSPYATILTGHTDNLYDVAHGPDGRTLATASNDGTTRLWHVADAHRPKALATIATGPDPVHGAAFGAGGAVLATAGEDRMIRLWDVTEPGSPVGLATVSGHTDTVTSVVFSTNGTLLASTGADRTVRLFDVTDPRNPRPLAVLGGSTEPVMAVTLSLDGRTLAAAGGRTPPRLWDISDPARPGPPEILDSHGEVVLRLAFSPDGRTLAVGQGDHTARLWDVSDVADPRERATLEGHTDSVRSVAFSPDGRTLATAGYDRTVRLWRLDGSPTATELMTLTGHTSVVATARFSPDGRTLASVGDDRTVRLWSLPGRVLAGHADSVYGVAYRADGRLVATVGRDEAIRLWETDGLDSATEVATLTGHGEIVRWVALSPDGRTMATTGHDRTVRLWNVSDPRAAHELSRIDVPTGSTISVAFSPDGRMMAATGEDHVVRMWDVTDPGHPEAISTMTDHGDVVGAVAFSPDGRSLATASLDRTARLWDITDPRRPRPTAILAEHTSPVGSVAFSPDGHTVVTTGIDRTARLWDVTDPGRARQVAVVTDHSDAVYSAAFSPDGRTLVTVSGDRSAKLWDVTDIAHPTEVATLLGHTDRVFMAVFRPDGSALATISQDHTTRLWDIDPERAVRRVCEVAYPSISRADWDEYLTGLRYSPPCATR